MFLYFIISSIHCVISIYMLFYIFEPTCAHARGLLYLCAGVSCWVGSTAPPGYNESTYTTASFAGPSQDFQSI